MPFKPGTRVNIYHWDKSYEAQGIDRERYALGVVERSVNQNEMLSTIAEDIYYRDRHDIDRTKWTFVKITTYDPNMSNPSGGMYPYLHIGRTYAIPDSLLEDSTHQLSSGMFKPLKRRNRKTRRSRKSRNRKTRRVR